MVPQQGVVSGCSSRPAVLLAPCQPLPLCYRRPSGRLATQQRQTAVASAVFCLSGQQQLLLARHRCASTPGWSTGAVWRCRGSLPARRLDVRRGSRGRQPTAQAADDGERCRDMAASSSGRQAEPFYRDRNDAAGEPSTSTGGSRANDDAEWAALARDIALSMSAAAPPFAAASFGGAAQAAGEARAGAGEGAGGEPPPSGTAQAFKELRQRFQKLYDRVYYGDVLPPVGSHQMSYARLLELLRKKRVKRVVLMADGQVALVELPAPGWASDYDTEIHERTNPQISYFKPRKEWEMEKMRFYCELPADIWDDGLFLHYIKSAQPVRPVNLEAKKLNLLREHQVVPELVILDPNNAYGFLNQYAGQFVPIAGLLVLRSVLGTGDALLKRFGKPKKDKMQEVAEQFTTFQGKEYNVAEGKAGAKRSTGVTYKDVAGIDAILDDIEECMRMLLGDDKFRKAGARPPRGILLEGPPGTGKTYLARAMAGEHGVPFFSANGAEFVEMFQGVAAARIRSLFARARKRAPSIVFIDEIDAIGKRRSSGPSDSGTQEREQGLLQMLFEMDGFSVNDRVLVIGATNRVDILDDALVRPGRFDRIIYMGRPSTSNRKKILQVHARNKPIPRGGDDALLGQVAELTVGYSGAELANLLNEAAILAVRKSQPSIELDIMLESMEKVRLGLPQPKLPDGAAKRHFAILQAGRAAAFALTRGMPPIERVSITPRAGAMAQILFVPQEFGKSGDQWHRLNATGSQVNALPPLAEPLSAFELCAGLLIPLCAARATEEVFFGRRGVTLASSKELSRATDLARYLVVGSTLHPMFRDVPVLYAMRMGGRRDPTTQKLESAFEPVIAAMVEAAYRSALRMAQQRRDAIEQIADEMLADREFEAVSGSRLVEILEATPLAPVLPVNEDGSPNAAADTQVLVPRTLARGVATAGVVTFRTAGAAGAGPASASFVRPQPAAAAPEVEAQAVFGGGSDMWDNEDLRAAVQVVLGKRDLLEMLGPSSGASKAQAVAAQLMASPATVERLAAVRSFATSTNGAPFPPPPADIDLGSYPGPALDDRARPQTEVVEF